MPRLGYFCNHEFSAGIPASPESDSHDLADLETPCEQLHNSSSPSNPSSHSRPAKKRKHGQHSQEFKVPSKRRKATGRPKNNWTQTRLRKLVRLYLLTDLEVGEIAKVLWRKDFHPCSRDVQKKLELLLQPRPNQLRQKKHSSRSRLDVLEECRRLHRSWRASKSPNLDQIRQSVDKGEILWNTSGSDLVPQDVITNDWWQRLDQILDQDSEILSQSKECTTSLPSWSMPDDTRPRITSISTLPEERSIPGLALSDFGSGQIPVLYDSDEPKDEQQMQLYVGSSEISQLDVRSSAPESRSFTECPVQGGLSETTTQSCKSPGRSIRNFSRPFVPSQSLPLLSSGMTMDTVANAQHPEEPSISIEDYDLVHSHPVPILNNNVLTGSLLECSEPEMSVLEDQNNAAMRVSIGGRSSQGSFLSITSLNRRLSSKYSLSDLQKIKSVMRLTVPRSSALFKVDERPSSMSSGKDSRAFPRQLELQRDHPIRRQDLGLRQQYDPPVVLPGIFHTFCTARMKEGSLHSCCRNGICEHHDPSMLQFFANKTSRGKAIKLWRITRDINDVDQFGNTVLHVAASLRLTVKYIFKLICQNADIDAINSAGQTFLHLLRNPNEADDVCLLLKILSVNDFNFLQQDQNGRSSLHCLLSPSLPQEYRKIITRRIDSLGLIKSDVRDNCGLTLSGLMKSACSQLFSITPSTDLLLESSPSSHLLLSKVNSLPGNYNILSRTVREPGQLKFLQGSQNVVHTEEDALRYYHADLLRTIVKSGENPTFEDNEGRNGIHCLAEVLIDLPQTITASTTNFNSTLTSHSSTSSSTPMETKREQYLHNLLAAGADPNSHDEQGMTPLMAFIIHTHRHRVAGWDEELEEDDDATIRLLTMLLNAKADINRRNCNGETALHLAVMLGRRAETKCLLAKGANVHVRNSKGQGVLNVGMGALNEAGRKEGGLGDERLYARIMLCMFVALSFGAVSEPTVLQEWTSTADRSVVPAPFPKKDDLSKRKAKGKRTAEIIVNDSLARWGLLF